MNIHVLILVNKLLIHLLGLDNSLLVIVAEICIYNLVNNNLAYIKPHLVFVILSYSIYKDSSFSSMSMEGSSSYDNGA